MRPLHAVVLCLVVVLAGCSTFVGSPTETAVADDPTTSGGGPATDVSDVPTTSDRLSTGTASELDLPPGVDESDVLRYSSLSSSERVTFGVARNATGYVELQSDSALETFSEHR